MQDNPEKAHEHKVEQASDKKSKEVFVWKKDNPEPKIGLFYTAFIFIFGFLLPIVVLSVELTNRMCSGALFEPLPTTWHAFLIGSVPIGNFTAL
ncbi:MAG: hypothetical protein H7263_18775 [Candidatus Sericytochromatia bacterium]|nr:hypothetical protein [Candidatus Sericytochromatia bacterium]